MKLPRLAFLLLVGPVLMAGTCVTSSHERSERGPWVGEVKNYGDGVVSDSLVRAQFTDANGVQFSVAAPTCPTRLATGETGTFEIFPYQTAEIVPPLHATFAAESTAVDLGRVRPAVKVEILEKDPARRYVFVRLTSVDVLPYSSVTLCANLRSRAGELLEVGNTYASPGSLRPGDSVTAIVYFNSFPADAEAEVIPQAQLGCCSPGISADDIAIESTKIVTDDTGKRLMLVVASAVNNSGVDLVYARLTAYVEGSAGDRADGVSGGCNGTIASGDRAPTSFLVPLPEGATNAKVVIPVIAGGTEAPGTIYRLNTQAITRDGNHVRGTVTNSGGELVWVSGVCFALRDRKGVLVGSAATRPEVPLQPGASVTLDALVPSTAAAASAELIAYGDNHPRLPPAY